MINPGQSSPARRRPWRLVRFYPAAVIAAGTLAIADSVYRLLQSVPDPLLCVLTILTVMSGSATLSIPGVAIGFSISDCFTMTAALLFGPAAGALTVAIDGLVISLRLRKAGLPVERALFNITAPPLAMWIAAQAFFFLAGADPLSTGASFTGFILPLAIFAGIFFVLNTALIAGAIAWDQRVAPFALWRRHFVGLWLTYFGGAAVAALLIALVNSRQQQFLVVALVSPIPFILYATFRNVVGRMEDRVKHLDEVNQMHVATIETLAHAIDAKDQVTHGHIRRVKHYAVALARAIGIADEAQLRAIEAASLLHDIGKLAVPEHILSKPTTLTPAEYDKMKRHADIGAEILSQVKFPFPVVPIVRHHHECWDGSGYPDGLKGEAIPLGARILAVVDCFDAITSDRPYRSALPLAEAIRILLSRSGTMYEPRLVDRFIDIQPGLSMNESLGSAGDAFTSIARTARAIADPTAEPVERNVLATVFELGTEIAAAPDVSSALARAHGTLRRVMPAATCVLYVYDRDADELVAKFTNGQHSDAIRGLSMPRGQRLTGWVAAHHQTVVNSDAALDLGNLIVRLDPTPQACLSAAVRSGDEVIGALTIYSAQGQSFTEADAAIVEVVASGLARALYAEKEAAGRGAESAPLSAAAAGATAIEGRAKLALVRQN